MTRLSDKLVLAKKRIIVPLDVSGEEEALALVRELKDHVGYFKVGLELLTSAGIGIVHKIQQLGCKIFYDGKFMDIPNTVAGASKAATRLAVDMFTVHAMGGLEMMRQAALATKSEADQLGIKPPKVLAVTMLTSIDRETMRNELQIHGEIEDQVVHLAKLAEQAGLDGIIASPQEIESIRKNISNNMIIITPGVRPVWAEAQDQKRVMTPSQAISKGAYAVVVGRPITMPPADIGGVLEATKIITVEIAGVLPDGEI